MKKTFKQSYLIKFLVTVILICVMFLTSCVSSVEIIDMEVPLENEVFFERWPSFEFSGHSYKFYEDSEPIFSALKYGDVCAKLRMVGEVKTSYKYPEGIVELSPILDDNEYVMLDPTDAFVLGYFAREDFTLPEKSDLKSYSGEMLIAKYQGNDFQDSEWVKTKTDVETVKKILDAYYNSSKPSKIDSNSMAIHYDCRLVLNEFKYLSVNFWFVKRSNKFYFLKGDDYYQIPNETVEHILTNLKVSTDDFYNYYYGVEK